MHRRRNAQDNYGPNGWTGGFNNGFGLTCYLSEIEARAAAYAMAQARFYSARAWWPAYSVA